ncbi:YcxB family protein [Caulobacter sp. DWP3-1-3b2]|uniref:YcxB family protein n=1 Tax=Caulobacter sp. DWP3-1-3b2 TaxID=2804643 RepID=UPI003CF6EED9
MTVGGALSKRLFGWRRFSFLVYLAVIAVMTLTWLALPDAIGLNDTLALSGLMISFVLAMFGYIFWCRRLGSNAWVRLGTLQQVDLSYEFNDVGLEIVSSSGVVTNVPWRAVLSVCREKTLWLLISTGGGTFYLPRRFFANATEEKALIAFCVDHLSPQARSRSPEATAFLAPT